MAIDLRAPGGIGHLRPVVLFKPRSVAQSVLINVEHGDFLRQIETQCFPGDREMAIAQPEEAAERKDCIGDPIVSGIKDDVLDRPQIFALRIDNLRPEDRFLDDDG